MDGKTMIRLAMGALLFQVGMPAVRAEEISAPPEGGMVEKAGMSPEQEATAAGAQKFSTEGDLAVAAAMAFVIPRPPPLPPPLPPYDGPPPPADGKPAPPVPNDKDGNPVLPDPKEVPAGPADQDVGNPPAPPNEATDPDYIPIDPEFEPDDEDCIGEDPQLDEEGNIVPIPLGPNEILPPAPPEPADLQLVYADDPANPPPAEVDPVI